LAIMEISVIPIGVGVSVSSYVAECVKIVQQSGLPYSLTPMGTIIEGDVEQLLLLASKLHKSPFSQSAKRVVTQIKIDERIDKSVSASYKVNSVISKI